jgi:phage baseplate assembly protein W
MTQDPALFEDSPPQDQRTPRYLDYPFRASGAGIPVTIADEQRAGLASDHLRDLIVQVLLTEPGERIELPEFGVGIQRLVFAPNNEALRASTRFLVTSNLQRWLGDRIDVERVGVTSEAGAEETVTIQVVYMVKQTRERQLLELQL